jgi:hypothetical protein
LCFPPFDCPSITCPLPLNKVDCVKLYSPKSTVFSPFYISRHWTRCCQCTPLSPFPSVTWASVCCNRHGGPSRSHSTWPHTRRSEAHSPLTVVPRTTTPIFVPTPLSIMSTAQVMYNVLSNHSSTQHTHLPPDRLGFCLEAERVWRRGTVCPAEGQTSSTYRHPIMSILRFCR